MKCNILPLLLDSTVACSISHIMAQGIGVGSRVSTSTYRFDDNAAAEETDKLSYTAFGLTWPSPRIIGTVQEKKGNKFSVKFDLDVEANTFEVEAEHLVLLSNETPKQSRSKGEVLLLSREHSSFFVCFTPVTT